jgi:hypothetical protein
MNPVDIIVVVFYLVGIVGIGVWAGVRKRAESGANRFFLIHATADQRQRVLCLNAIRVYRLPEGIVDQGN